MNYLKDKKRTNLLSLLKPQKHLFMEIQKKYQLEDL